MEPASNQIKGIALRNFRPILEKLAGEAAAAAVMSELPTEVTAALPAVVPTAWYPLDWYRSMHAVARRLTRSGSGLPRQIGYESTRRDLTGVYRIFLSVLAPQTILSAAARVFGRYYAKGQMRVPEMRKGFARVRLSGCDGFDHNVFQDVIGGSEAGLVLAGAESLRIHTVSGGQDGDTTLEVVALWT